MVVKDYSMIAASPPFAVPAAGRDLPRYAKLLL